MVMDDSERIRQGMSVRREVLGDEHVDRAVAGTTAFTEPFREGGGAGGIREAGPG
jgi:4-carboxymuconolactone decarboxylase